MSTALLQVKTGKLNDSLFNPTLASSEDIKSDYNHTGIDRLEYYTN